MTMKNFSMIPHSAIEPLIKAIEQAERKTWSSIKTGDITQEPKITTTLASRIVDGCNEVFQELGLDIEVTFKDFDDRGPGAEESIYGADLGVTIRIDNNLIPINQRIKSVLIQAKKPENQSKKDVIESLGKMISIAGAGKNGSFIAVYDKEGTKVSSCRQIENADFNANAAQGESLGSFFRNFLRCKTGRRGLDPRTLKPVQMRPKKLLEFIVHKR